MPHLDAEAGAALLALGPPLHHLLDCPACRQRLRLALIPPGSTTRYSRGAEAGDAPTFAESLFRRALHHAAESEIELAESSTEAAGVFTDFLSLPLATRLATPPFHHPELCSPGFAQHLLRLAEDDSAEPLLALHQASLALSLLDDVVISEETVQLRARALQVVASSQRRRGLLDLASDTLVIASTLLDAEPLDAYPRALLCRCLAAVRRDQRRLDEALALLERAGRLLTSCSDWPGLAQTRLAQAWILLEEMEHVDALALLSEALALLDPATQPRLAFDCLHALALVQAELGLEDSVRVTLAALRQLRPLLPDHPDLRVRWISAQASWRLDESPDAIKRLRRVFKALRSRGTPVEAATAALELALWALQASPARPRLLAELHDDLAADARLPLHLWQVVSFALSFAELQLGYVLDLLSSALRYLEMAQFNPDLPFHPLQDPDDVLLWTDLSLSAREASALAAGVQLDQGLPTTPLGRLRLAWAHETLTGIRVE